MINVNTTRCGSNVYWFDRLLERQPRDFRVSVVSAAAAPTSSSSSSSSSVDALAVKRFDYKVVNLRASSPPKLLELQRRRREQKHQEEEGERNLKMGNDDNDERELQRKPRFLCLHGFRTNGEILKKQVGKWHESVLNKIELVFLDAPFPAEGKSDVEGIFDPPFYEWFQFDKDFLEYRNFDECLAFIENYMLQHGPFDGLLGFSQGAILSAAMPGFQAKGVALTKVPKIKFLIIVGGAKFLSPIQAELAYSSPIECPSLHFLGEADFLKPHGLRLLESFVDPQVIHHPRGHTIPRLDEKGLEIMHGFIDKITCSLSPPCVESNFPDKELKEASYIQSS